MTLDYNTVPESRLEPIWESAYTMRIGFKKYASNQENTAFVR